MSDSIPTKAVRSLSRLLRLGPKTEVVYTVRQAGSRSDPVNAQASRHSPRWTTESGDLEALYAANRKAAAQVYIDSATLSGASIPARIFALAEVSPAPQEEGHGTS